MKPSVRLESMPPFSFGAVLDIALAVDKAIDGVMLKYLNERIVPILGRLAGALATQQRVDAPTGGAGSTGITAPHPSQVNHFKQFHERVFSFTQYRCLMSYRVSRLRQAHFSFSNTCRSPEVFLNPASL
jgi:hypothetical protein